MTISHVNRLHGHHTGCRISSYRVGLRSRLKKQANLFCSLYSIYVDRASCQGGVLVEQGRYESALRHSATASPTTVLEDSTPIQDHPAASLPFITPFQPPRLIILGPETEQRDTQRIRVGLIVLACCDRQHIVTGVQTYAEAKHCISVQRVGGALILSCSAFCYIY